MTVNIENEYGTIDGFEPSEIAEVVLKEGLKQHFCPYECEINIILTDNEGIRRVNSEFRDIDNPTDVLSFPMLDYEAPCDFSMVSADDMTLFNPENKELMLGDIMISMEKVKSQAEEYGHSTKREFAFLIAHSLLHLLGYDHMEDNERIEMEELQEKLLTSVGISR